MENINVKLLVFGTVISDLKTDFDNLCSSSKIVYLGWQHPDDIYKFLTISNLAAFPGKHSVLWEQSVGVGIPCIFRRIDGFTHIDIGGNCRFFTGLSEQKIKEDLLQIVENKKLYDDLKANAQKEQKNDFLYSVISKKSIKE